MRAFKETATPTRLLLTFDVKAAHRLVPIHEADWGLQACRLDDDQEVYVNCLGTFGVATAAFWWGHFQVLPQGDPCQLPLLPPPVCR